METFVDSEGSDESSEEEPPTRLSRHVIDESIFDERSDEEHYQPYKRLRTRLPPTKLSRPVIDESIFDKSSDEEPPTIRSRPVIDESIFDERSDEEPPTRLSRPVIDESIFDESSDEEPYQPYKRLRTRLPPTIRSRPVIDESIFDESSDKEPYQPYKRLRTRLPPTIRSRPVIDESIFDESSDEEPYQPYKRLRTRLPPTRLSRPVIDESIFDESSDEEPYHPYKRLRTRLLPTTPSMTVTTSAANVSAAAVQEDDFHGEMLSGDYSDDMEGLDEEPNQSEGEEESGPEGSDEEGPYNREEDGEDGDYQIDQEDEWSDEVDEINEGQAIGGRDIASNEVSYGNTAGSLGTKSSKMFGIFTDQDVLDCPICCEALTVPVSQCENGHIACSSCCLRIGYKCPSCSLRIGHIRCRPIERIINSVKFSCPNLEYECKEMVLYSDREEHGKACIFAPCSCPLESCDYVGSAKNLYAHFGTKHIKSATHFNFKQPLKILLDSMTKPFILQEKTDGTIFILNHADATSPFAINLICIGTLLETREFYYELSLDVEDDTLTLKSVAATITKWSASQPISKYLLVPFDFTYNGIISVKVCIEKR